MPLPFHRQADQPMGEPLDWDQMDENLDTFEAAYDEVVATGVSAGEAVTAAEAAAATATTQAGIATTKAGEADTAKTAAEAAAGTATTQAGIATTKAGEADTAKTAAEAAAGTATTQAGIATTKAGEADTAKTAAEAAAGTATTQAALSAAWAEGTEPGGPGTKSAAEHAADAAAAAASVPDINDAGTALDEVWSSSKTSTELAGKEDAGTSATAAAAAVTAHEAAGDPHPGYVLESTLGAVNGVAQLGADQKLLPGQLPAIAITEYLGGSANEAAMLALVGQSGDWTIRADLGTVWVITGTDPTQIADWTELGYPTAPVTSVAGKTGAVVLVAADLTDATAAGLALLTAADVAAQRVALGLETVGQAEAEAGTATTTRAWTAQRVWQAIAAWWLSISTAAGRTLVTAADAAAQRTALGLVIGTNVQAFDADTAKLDVAQTFTARQKLTSQFEGLVAGGTGGSYEMDLATGNVFTRTFNAVATLSFANVPASSSIHVKLIATNPGASGITLPANTRVVAGEAYQPTASGVDELYFASYDGGTSWTLTVAKDVRVPS